VLDLVQIILPRGLLSKLCEAQLRNPDQIRANESQERSPMRTTLNPACFMMAMSTARLDI